MNEENILIEENKRLAAQVRDLAMLIQRLARHLPERNGVRECAISYLERNNLLGNPLRSSRICDTVATVINHFTIPPGTKVVTEQQYALRANATQESLKTIKVSDLSGAQLDYQVALALGMKFMRVDNGVIQVIDDSGFNWLCRPPEERDNAFTLKHLFSPSTNWLQAGPIIDREGITIGKICVGGWYANSYTEDGCGERECYGKTPLEAAMRLYVNSNFGDEVTVAEG